MAGEVEYAVPLGRLEQLAGYRLRRAHHVFQLDFSRALEGTGVRQPLLGVLSAVVANPGISQGAVGRALGIQRANMVALVGELVERGLVERRVSESDRRAFELTATRAGADLLADCLRRIDAHEERMLAGLSGAERTTLLDLLARIETQAR